jgi:hypothetical protein
MWEIEKHSKRRGSVEVSLFEKRDKFRLDISAVSLSEREIKVHHSNA